MKISTERLGDEISRTVELARYDNQVIGASVFFSASELRAMGVDPSSANCLLLEIIDTRHGLALNVSGQADSDSQHDSNSLGD